MQPPITFHSEIKKIGNSSYGFIIPKDLVKHGLIQTKKKYEVSLQILQKKVTGGRNAYPDSRTPPSSTQQKKMKA